MLTEQEQYEVRSLLEKSEKSEADVNTLTSLLEKRYGQEIFNKALRFILTVLGYSDRELAKDWRQTVLISLICKRRSGKSAIDQYDPAKANCEDGYSGWIECIIERKIIDLQRQLKRDPHYMTESGNVGSVDDDDVFTDKFTNYEDPDAISPERELCDKEIGAQIRKAVKRLPPKQRQALTLNKIQKLSYKEAAAAMGANLNTFKAHVREANKNLQKFLRHVYEELDAA